MELPRISDMSVLPVEAEIANRDMVFHFSSNIPGFFAIEDRRTVTRQYGPDEPGLAGQSYTYVSSDMTGPVQMSEIVHYSGVLMYFPAVVDGAGCFVRIDPIDPEKLEFRRSRTDKFGFGASVY